MATLAEVRQQYPEYADMSDSDLAYGLYRKFYSDIPVAGFAKQLGMTGQQAIDFLRVAGQGGDSVRFSDGAANVGGAGAGTSRGLLQGMTFGAGDEIVAGGTALGRRVLQGDERPLADIYSQELDRERSRLGQFRETNPVLAYGSEMAGGVALPIGAATSVKGAAGIGGTTGALYGGLSSEGGAENRATGAVTGGVLGALLGGGIHAAAGGITRRFEEYMTKRAARAVAEGADSIQQLRDEATRAYEVARSSGVVVDENAYKQLIDRVTSDVAGGAGRPVRAGLIPKSADVLDAMRDYAGKAVGIDDLEYLRQLAQTPAGMATDKAEQRAASLIIGGIDDFMENLGPQQVRLGSGYAQDAIEELTRARELWGRMRRSETIQNIIDVAKSGGYAGGFESGIKTQIGRILRNPKLQRGFSEAELDLLSQIQQGTPVGRVIAGISYLGFSPSGGRTPLMGGGLITGAAAGGLAGGPVGALLGAAGEATATTVLRAVREKSLAEQAQLYAQILASGRADEVVRSYPSVMRYLESVAAAATRGGAAVAPSDILTKPQGGAN